eukprot:TRINITY_DN2494_c0_g1_i2.p1 TRINITY_DN2494_c0_g1~~TRINITY_DN2494_c0_g1_i2.p1  ORF type:complete len:271 (+),score=113.36 TRINITY_DN2494_c0_g1_i2:63-875(+)
MYRSFLLLLGAACAAAYPGQVKYFFCDLKTSLNTTQLTMGNYKAVLDAFQDEMHCNGVRVPLLPTVGSPRDYPDVYHAAVKYARSKQMAIYANPMENAFRIRRQDYSKFVAAYADHFEPDFLGVFNEGGQYCDGDCMARVTAKVRGLLTTEHPVKFVGVDLMHVDKSLKVLMQHADLVKTLDVLSSHNAGGDSEATKAEWKKLVAFGKKAGKPVWASENPDTWQHGPYSNLTDSIEAGVDGLLTWKTFNKLVDPQGKLTKAGKDIAPHFA